MLSSVCASIIAPFKSVLRLTDLYFLEINRMEKTKRKVVGLASSFLIPSGAWAALTRYNRNNPYTVCLLAFFGGLTCIGVINRYAWVCNDEGVPLALRLEVEKDLQNPDLSEEHKTRVRKLLEK